MTTENILEAIIHFHEHGDDTSWKIIEEASVKGETVVWFINETLLKARDSDRAEIATLKAQAARAGVVAEKEKAEARVAKLTGALNLAYDALAYQLNADDWTSKLQERGVEALHAISTALASALTPAKPNESAAPQQMEGK